MKIQLRFFASLREALGSEGEILEVDRDAPRVADIVALLRARGGRWADAFATDKTLMAARNQEMCDDQTPLADGDELAFFPPVTGG